MTTVLSCEKLQAGYAGNSVVRDLDLRVEAGEVLALLGPNGAGKTTTLLTITGLLPKLGGRVTICADGMTKHKAANPLRSGVVFVPDDRALFTTLSVRQNLMLAGRKGGPSMAAVLELFPELDKRVDLATGMLSGGEQQMLAIGRAIMQQPKVLLIDELSMGLAPVIVKKLLPVVRSIANSKGVGVVLVEQHVHLALEIADRAIVLVHGRSAYDGSASELAANPSLLENTYLGL
jgi:branched-chain amino acid transport system ATP-binding protein